MALSSKRKRHSSPKGDIGIRIPVEPHSKRCCFCKDKKLITEFTISCRATGARQKFCKACKRQYNSRWYAKHKAEQIKRARKNNAAYKEKAYREVNRLKDAPCTDCGNRYPSYVMDWDHLDGEDKEGSVSAMIAHGYSINTILSEIMKCELVCSNCHRIRTHRFLQVS